MDEISQLSPLGLAPNERDEKEMFQLNSDKIMFY
jgi:hypothetical protein